MAGPNRPRHWRPEVCRQRSAPPPAFPSLPRLVSADTLAKLIKAPVEWRGQTDLAIGGLKCAGNAQRRRRRFLLFHGSFLLHLDLGLLEKILPLPSHQPDYRLNRSHSDFLVNLNLPNHRSEEHTSELQSLRHL